MRQVTRTERNLWSAFLGEAKANRLYTAYAWKAMEEGYPEVAQVFLEAAGAETVHALSHLRVAGEVHSTKENLLAVIGDEAYEIDTMYPRMIQEAAQEGRHDAVTTFQMAWEREKHHLWLFQQALKSKGWDSRGHQSPPAPPPAVAATGELSPSLLRNAAREVGLEKARIARLARIREVIFGMQDGLISTAILVSSVYGATRSSLVTIIAGLAGGLGGVVSMSAGSFLSSRAEKEVQEAEIRREARELRDHPAEEMAEMVELFRRDGLSEEDAISMAEKVAQDPSLMLRTMVEKELGLTPELPASPWRDAAVMGVSFFVGAALPILPYFLPLSGVPLVVVSLTATGAGLFGMGVGKTRVTGRNPLLSGLEVLAVGVLAGVLGYLLGAVVPGLFGVVVSV